MKKLESQLLQAAVEVQSVLTDLGHRFCIIGGLAVSRWGEPRTTQDVDVSLLVEIGDEQRVSKKVLSRLRPRFPYSLDLALKQRIILAVAANDVGVDIALASFPFEYRVIERASSWKLNRTTTITTVSAEDLVVLKAFAGRPKDWQDIRGVLIRQQDKLNWATIEQELHELTELRPEEDMLGRLTEIRHQIEVTEQPQNVVTKKPRVPRKATAPRTKRKNNDPKK